MSPTPPSRGAGAAAVLDANSAAYEWLVGRVRSMDAAASPEAVLRAVEHAAWVAGDHHPGRFADGALENVALEIGARLDGATGGGFPLPSVPRDGRRRVLHVTPLLTVGGHTPLLYHWVRSDRTSRHSVALVSHAGGVPDELAEAVRSSGGQLVVLPPGAPFTQRARWLRELARRTADLVAWHVIGADAVPTAAFADPDGPPVALVDHCDHVFWLGGSVADVLVNLRRVGAEHTAARRFVGRHAVVPIPLRDRLGETSRHDARRALGMGEDEVVLLSVGRGVKYRPCGAHDFVATAHRILERHPEAHLFVAGASQAGISPHLRRALHPRLHLEGTVRDPARHRAAADVYLESFPYGSQTALLEAALGGLPVVPAYAPLCPLLVASDDAVDDVVPHPRSEGEYVEQVDALVREPGRRRALGETLRRRLLVGHVGEGWLERLAALYRETDGLAHRPRPIPIAPCLSTEVDLGLARWHVMADGRRSSSAIPGTARGSAARHAAYVAKLVGDYRTARRHALRAVREDPSRTSWRLLAVALLGRGARGLRRLVPARAKEVGP